MKNKLRIGEIVLGALVLCSSSGCLAAAAGVGAETAYVATQDDRTSREVLNDQRITAEIKTKFLANQSVPGMDINIDTNKGVVTLRGVLRDEKQVVEALKIANSTSGVKEVKSELHIG